MIASADEDRLDAALARLAPFGPDLANGMTSHGPMVVEALSVLGRADASDPWIERHLADFTPWTAKVAPIDASDWRVALGHPGRAADWRAFFETIIAEDGWRAVLDLWCARLAPGAATAAMHGLIRVGHAARALGRRDSGPRRDELAAALALWASNYRALPGEERNRSAGHPPREALARVGFLPEAQRRNGGAITAALEQLRGHPAFLEVIDLLEPADDLDSAVRDLVALFARVFLANARTPLGGIVFTHGVTVFGAVGAIAPSVSEATARALLRHAWQSAAALYAAYGTAPPLEDVSAIPAPPADLVDLAVADGDDHVIKLTEAILTWAPRDATAMRLGPALIALMNDG